jgi:hypothetical protein
MSITALSLLFLSKRPAKVNDKMKNDCNNYNNSQETRGNEWRAPPLDTEYRPVHNEFIDSMHKQGE